jgi:hypothetical protein
MLDGHEVVEGRDEKLAAIKSQILNLASFGPGFKRSSYRRRDRTPSSKRRASNATSLQSSDAAQNHSIHPSNEPVSNSAENEDQETLQLEAFREIAVSDALQRLQAIRNSPPLYPTSLSILIWGLSSAGCAGLFFSGGWWDILCSFVIGGFVGALYKVSHSSKMARVFEFLSALVVGFCVELLVFWKVPICYTTVCHSLSFPKRSDKQLTNSLIICRPLYHRSFK